MMPGSVDGVSSLGSCVWRLVDSLSGGSVALLQHNKLAALAELARTPRCCWL
jgi:hypothetical protein